MAFSFPFSGSDFLVLGIARTPWTPHGSGLGLSGIYRSEPIWSVDRHPHPSTTLYQTNTGFFRPSFSRFDQTIFDRQPPALHHPSVCEGEIFTGTTILPSVHTVSAACTRGSCTSNSYRPYAGKRILPEPWTKFFSQ